MNILYDLSHVPGRMRVCAWGRVLEARWIYAVAHRPLHFWLAGVLYRITSYNVCYTKLLRIDLAEQAAGEHGRLRPVGDDCALMQHDYAFDLGRYFVQMVSYNFV